MSETKECLPVPGYRAQREEAIAAVTTLKHQEEVLLQFLEYIEADPDLAVDRRWLSIGRTAIEQGFMAVNRSVFKPERVQLAGGSLVEQAGDAD